MERTIRNGKVKQLILGLIVMAASPAFSQEEKVRPTIEPKDIQTVRYKILEELPKKVGETHYTILEMDSEKKISLRSRYATSNSLRGELVLEYDDAVARLRDAANDLDSVEKKSLTGIPIDPSQMPRSEIGIALRSREDELNRAHDEVVNANIQLTALKEILLFYGYAQVDGDGNVKPAELTSEDVKATFFGK